MDKAQLLACNVFYRSVGVGNLVGIAEARVLRPVSTNSVAVAVIS